MAIMADTRYNNDNDIFCQLKQIEHTKRIYIHESLKRIVHAAHSAMQIQWHPRNKRAGGEYQPENVNAKERELKPGVFS